VELFGANTICFADRNARQSCGFPLSESEEKREGKCIPRVIVVDDERLLADTTATILRRAGFDTRTAYDAFSALEVITSFHPDYLLTDIMMPGMNGVQLAIAIAKMHPLTKIMLFSGQAGITDILEESHAKGYEFPLLAKPVHPLKLVEGLKGLSDR
jgi:CheY-like chemotaxis protein